MLRAPLYNVIARTILVVCVVRRLMVLNSISATPVRNGFNGDKATYTNLHFDDRRDDSEQFDSSPDREDYIPRDYILENYIDVYHMTEDSTTKDNTHTNPATEDNFQLGHLVKEHVPKDHSLRDLNTASHTYGDSAHADSTSSGDPGDRTPEDGIVDDYNQKFVIPENYISTNHNLEGSTEKSHILNNHNAEGNIPEYRNEKDHIDEDNNAQGQMSEYHTLPNEILASYFLTKPTIGVRNYQDTITKSNAMEDHTALAKIKDDLIKENHLTEDGIPLEGGEYSEQTKHLQESPEKYFKDEEMNVLPADRVPSLNEDLRVYFGYERVDFGMLEGNLVVPENSTVEEGAYTDYIVRRVAITVTDMTNNEVTLEFPHLRSDTSLCLQFDNPPLLGQESKWGGMRRLMNTLTVTVTKLAHATHKKCEETRKYTPGTGLHDSIFFKKIASSDYIQTFDYYERRTRNRVLPTKPTWTLKMNLLYKKQIVSTENKDIVIEVFPCEWDFNDKRYDLIDYNLAPGIFKIAILNV